MSNNSNGELSGLEVAVLGMACKFPGANNIDEFWRNLVNGVESITYYTADDLEAAGEDPDLVNAPGYVKVARTIDHPDLFDAAFFNISPREAELLDPQKRLFLECAWQAQENAGYDSEAYDGSIGIFAGEKLSSYLIHIYSHPEIIQRMGEFQTQIANDKDYLATRIAYKLSLGGPSVTVQTACSTSLVATHLACQSLLAGECDMALAGGVSLRADQGGYLFIEGEIYSPDGRIRAFDADANGTIFGNGLGIVVLKRLEDAVADCDHIRAVIRGSAVNNDSSLKVGYTAPGADGQARVIRAAQTIAEVDAESITYIEAHGTGTPTGDPIEISALTRAFRESTQKSGFCAVGSVKTNVGHLGAAAGVAGLIKTVLALEHRQLPPSLLYEKPNPQIDFESSPFFVNSELREWRSNGGPLRAGVSAFGIGGTNAHAIVEEAPRREPTSPSRPWQLLLLSARTDTALETATANLAAHFKAHPELDLADAAYTLQVGRRPFEHRRMLVCRDLEDATAALEAVDPKRIRTLFAEIKKRSVAFMFSGQGAQYPGMGHGL
ncbi:MAG: type I polyketide synthase, partial [Thermoanaerobaculia bacterium]